MVVIMKPDFTGKQLEEAIRAMEAGGVKVMVSKGSEVTILGAEGDASRLDQEYLSQLDGVDRVMRVTEPYKKANRKYHPDDSVIDMGGGVSIGGDKLVVIAGPCSVESESQMVGVAQAVKASGAAALRGGRSLRHAGGRLQAPHLSLLFSGQRSGGHSSAAGRQGRHRHAHRH